ncbi:hypothetical protein GCM10009612_05650 [Streptomyces beijiangensis]
MGAAAPIVRVAQTTAAATLREAEIRIVILLLDGLDDLIITVQSGVSARKRKKAVRGAALRGWPGECGSLTR